MTARIKCLAITCADADTGPNGENGDGVHRVGCQVDSPAETGAKLREIATSLRPRDCHVAAPAQ